MATVILCCIVTGIILGGAIGQMAPLPFKMALHFWAERWAIYIMAGIAKLLKFYYNGIFFSKMAPCLK